MADKSKREFLEFCAKAAVACPAFLLNNGFLYADKPEGLWEWSKEAMFYSKKGTTLYCELCPNECIIRPDKKGDCWTRINKAGKLYSITYGNPCAIHSDPIEKKPLFHFLPKSRAFSIATAGCNFKCLNCQNWQISQASPEDTDNYDLMPDKTVEKCLKYKCKSIAYTYTEPVVFYEYMYDTAKIAHKKGIKNLMITCGNINKKPLKKLCKYIDAANVDLKGFDNEIYKKLNGGELQPVLNTLKTMRDENVWIEITNLIVPEWTDDLNMIKKMCKWLVKNKLDKYPLHFSRFHPSYKLTNLPYTPLKTLKDARKIALDEGMKYVYIGNVPGEGFESTYCHSCGKLLIERKGYHILQNHIKNSKCEYCGEIIPGVWV